MAAKEVCLNQLLVVRVAIFFFIMELSIHYTKACFLQQRYTPKITQPIGRDETLDCACGVDPMETTNPDPARNDEQKPWNMYIHVSNPKTKTLIRTCTGTIINAKMLLTAHRCLIVKKGRIPVFEGWEPRPKHIDEDSVRIAREQWLKVSFEPNFSEKLIGIEIQEIIYKHDWMLNNTKKELRDDDMAIIVLKGVLGFAGDQNPIKPICVPKTNHEMLDLTGYKGYFYGLGGELEADVNPEARFVGNVVIVPGELCDKAVGYPGFSEKSTLCVQSRVLAPSFAGGPLLISEDGQINRRGFTTQKNVFMVGLSSVATKKPKNGPGTIETTYFTNILPLIKYIEYHGKRVNAKWCKTNPNLKLDPKNRVDPKTGIRNYLEWEGDDPIKRDESLDCVCGLHNLETKVKRRRRRRGAKPRVIGGEEAIPYEFPWMAYYYSDWHNLPGDSQEHQASECGGSIINDRMILTAAHCVIRESRLAKHKSDEALPDWSTQILYRKHIYDDNNEPMQIKAEVEKIYYSKDFTEIKRQKEDSTTDGDIALVILKSPLIFSKAKKHGQSGPHDVRPICLPRPETFFDFEGKQGLVAGWGEQLNPDPNGPPLDPVSMNKLEIDMLNFQECINRTNFPLRNTMLCAGYWTYLKDSSRGDSGGPLIVRSKDGYWVQVGIVSSGKDEYDYYTDDQGNPGAAYSHTISIYTNLQKYIRFVDYYSNQVGAKWCKSYIK